LPRSFAASKKAKSAHRVLPVFRIIDEATREKLWLGRAEISDNHNVAEL
jgi:hypothetical protein